MMNLRTILLTGVVAGTVLFVFSTPSPAAMLSLGGQEGTQDPPQPTEGAETEEDWNPTITCSVAPPQGIWHLLDCLLDEISNPPPPCSPSPILEPDPVAGLGGEEGSHEFMVVLEPRPGGGDDDCYPYPQERSDFTVTLLPSPRYGVEIRRRDDGGEIERISLRENDPGIQTTELEMEPRQGRFARIGEIDEVPLGGTLHLTVNDVRLRINTRRSRTSVEVTGDLVRELRGGGFAVGYESPYLYVYQSSGIYLVQFRSTDPGITRSDLGLFPEEMGPPPPDEGPSLDPGDPYPVELPQP